MQESVGTLVLSDLWSCKMSVRREHDKVNDACGKQGKRKKSVGERLKEGRKCGEKQRWRDRRSRGRFRCAGGGEVRI